jgi:hypothetical protein
MLDLFEPQAIDRKDATQGGIEIASNLDKLSRDIVIRRITESNTNDRGFRAVRHSPSRSLPKPAERQKLRPESKDAIAALAAKMFTPSADQRSRGNPGRAAAPSQSAVRKYVVLSG